MASRNPEDPGMGSPRKRSESAANPPRPGPCPTPEARPGSKDRSQSVTRNEGQRPPSKGFDGADLVFPIRSVVSVDPTASQAASAQARSAASPTREGARQYSIIDSETWQKLRSQKLHNPQPAVPSDVPRHETHPVNDKTELATHSMASVVAHHPERYAKPVDSDGRSASQTPPPASDQPYSHMTSRFKHVMTESGHAVITGRDGAKFQYCEDEPIRIPGAIQSFGVMIAMREESPNQLVVHVASENSEQFMGYSPKQLFELENFCDILKDDQADVLLDHIDFVRDDAYDPSVDGPEVFILSIPTPSGETRRFWCAVHVSQANKDIIICEFELEDDEVNPLNVAGRSTPALPSDTLGVTPTTEQLAASTMNISQPLRVLRNARRRRGEAAAMEVFSLLTQIQEQLGRAQDLDTLLNTTSGLVKELTGFHRVLIYQFDSSWNGMVVSELVDPDASIDLYKGLHFPASDIPAQARELYKINKVRLLYDRDQLTSRLVCRTLEDLETPLDMTHAYLRAMSPIHIKYLAHMKVRSSMSISVNAFNDLWGLISCHSYGSSGMRVSFPIRKMCRLLGDTVSRNIERLSYASRLQARKLINTAPTEANPSGYIIASSDDLLQLFDADYGALSIRDETKILGDNTHSQEILALLEFLRVRKMNSVLASHDITKDFPDLHYAPGFKAISGLLYVPLSTSGRDFIAFFRKGHLTEIKWAGNPYEIGKRKETAGYLEPRQSFAAWRETVLSQSREWSESDVETAAVLCLVYGKFIKVWRQKEAAMQNSQLTRLLLANSAHEFRTPLNAIINYLEIALEGALDNETRESLTKSHSASKSLIYVINDLLDLTNTEQGQELIKAEPFDLKATFDEAADMLAGEAKRKKISYTVTAHSGLPPAVLGDQRRVRQVFSNIISNAFQYTTSGAVTVDILPSSTQSLADHVAVEMIAVDTGVGMAKETLETLSQELEQISSDDNHYFENEIEEDEQSAAEKPRPKRVLGLGLALVARIAHSMHGQLSVKSEEGKGSQFKILLHFRLPDEGSASTPAEAVLPAHASVPPTPLNSDKEFTLVGGVYDDHEERRRSSVSVRSGGSSHSGKSQADRLISAIQESPLERSPSEDSRTEPLTSPGIVSNEPLTMRPPSLDLQELSTTQGPRTSLAAVTHTPPLSRQAMVTPPGPGVENIPDHGISMDDSRVSERDVKWPSAQVQTIQPQSYLSSMPATSAALSETPSTTVQSSPAPTTALSTDSRLLNVLVAEDDPINSKILHKRLTKLGHTVQLTGNGEACANLFSSASRSFDVVLMDIQMPIMDGMAATRMIREFEAKAPINPLSEKAKQNNRVPIFAVSASLLEREKQTYIDTGFDGWVMKPINFERLNIILSGLVDMEARKSATYRPGEWENGGWFDQR
ncbi:CheY-like superfamily [Penicillium riverlandense]|uniref:CheY-like superfamily n=1 Tax=Penicillium riverlandense TaxID=1903569 RepID=UPI00254942B2|nr:CheY-like superfamily [Penicillium riverlandense]KAJ5833937.1 CheY-like superfamily [Penicillium riverlandense]